MKSSLMLAWSCAVGLGQPHGDFCPTAPGIAIVYNVEDDKEEQRRRLSAVLRQFDAIPADIRGKVIRTGPPGVGALFVMNNGAVSSTPAMDRLRALIKEQTPAVLIADPLAELHTAEENDNTALRAVIAEFRAIAIEFNVAVILIHHTRKGAVIPGDPDAARGASAIIGAGRIVLTIVTMSEDDAKALGVPEDRKNRSRYVRLDDAKQNYAGIGDAQWYEKALYNLDNGETIVAAVPWHAPDAFAALTTTTINQILNKIDAGPYEGGRYSPAANAADERAPWLVVQELAPTLTKEQCKNIIATWLKNDVLLKRDYKDPKRRGDQPGLFVGKRPGDIWEIG